MLALFFFSRTKSSRQSFVLSRLVHYNNQIIMNRTQNSYRGVLTKRSRRTHTFQFYRIRAPGIHYRADANSLCNAFLPSITFYGFYLSTMSIFHRSGSERERKKSPQIKVQLTVEQWQGKLGTMACIDYLFPYTVCSARTHTQVTFRVPKTQTNEMKSRKGEGNRERKVDCLQYSAIPPSQDRDTVRWLLSYFLISFSLSGVIQRVQQVESIIAVRSFSTSFGQIWPMATPFKVRAPLYLALGEQKCLISDDIQKPRANADDADDDDERLNKFLIS